MRVMPHEVQFNADPEQVLHDGSQATHVLVAELTYVPSAHEIQFLVELSGIEEAGHAVTQLLLVDSA